MGVMVLDVIDEQELERIMQRSRYVLVLVYSSAAPQGRYLSGLVDSIARSLEPVVAVVKLDSVYAPWAEDLLGSAPRLVFFKEGRKVWEQIGFFYESTSDRFAIRRGLLYALRARGLSPSKIGIKLNF